MPADFLTKWIPRAKFEQSVVYATNSDNAPRTRTNDTEHDSSIVYTSTEQTASLARASLAWGECR